MLTMRPRRRVTHLRQHPLRYALDDKKIGLELPAQILQANPSSGTDIGQTGIVYQHV